MERESERQREMSVPHVTSRGTEEEEDEEDGGGGISPASALWETLQEGKP